MDNSISEKDAVKDLITGCGAVLKGHFKLASGRHSDTYIEKFRVLERPAVLHVICERLADHFREVRPEIVAGPSTGGMIVAYEMARQFGLAAVYIELQDGKRALRRGGSIRPGSRVLLVDDVLTTGISLLETAEVIRSCQASIVGVGVLIDRSAAPVDFGCDLFAAGRFEAQSYAETEIPPWLAKIPLHTPGTRASTKA